MKYIICWLTLDFTIFDFMLSSFVKKQRYLCNTCRDNCPDRWKFIVTNIETAFKLLLETNLVNVIVIVITIIANFIIIL